MKIFADDGTEFDTVEECTSYEEQLKKVQDDEACKLKNFVRDYIDKHMYARLVVMNQEKYYIIALHDDFEQAVLLTEHNIAIEFGKRVVFNYNEHKMKNSLAEAYIVRQLSDAELNSLKGIVYDFFVYNNFCLSSNRINFYEGGYNCCIDFSNAEEMLIVIDRIIHQTSNMYKKSEVRNGGTKYSEENSGKSGLVNMTSGNIEDFIRAILEI